MAFVRAEDKVQLEERGHWRAFCNYRKELTGTGMKSGEALRLALDKYLEMPPIEPDETGVKAKKPHKWNSKRNRAKEEKESAQVIPVESINPITDDEMRDLPEQSKPVELVRWVASNLRGNINYETCPGRDAYNFLQECLASVSFRTDFWMKMFVKVLPSRAVLTEDDMDAELDGASTVRVLDKILSIAERVKSRAKELDTE